MMVSAEKVKLNTKRFIHSTGQPLADQYYHIYNYRLNAVRDTLIRSAQSRWGKEVKNVPLEHLNASLGSTDVFVIGTLFKSMPKQPSILREIEGNDTSISSIDESMNTSDYFVSDEDSLVLHEIDENVQVVGDIDVHSHVTGIPVALLGHQLNGGAKFHVVDACYAGPSLDVYKETAMDTNGSSDENNDHLLIVSGFEFGFDLSMPKEETNRIVESLKKLRDFVHGSNKEMPKKKIVRVIVAGNSIAPGYTKAKLNLLGPSEEKDTSKLKDIIYMFDRYLHDLAQSGVETTLMPGRNDPTSFLLPQQPFHPKILPKSGRLDNLHPNTNPCLMECMHRVILGTSGDNIEAIRQHSRIEYSTTALKSTLEWGHIAPSAPDNVSCLPFKDRDPFIIDYVPDIYFAGNQPEYTVTTYSCSAKPKIQLISVPSFVKTQSCVVVNLKNLECDLLNFSS